jgi:site-specific recombinase XerD
MSDTQALTTYQSTIDSAVNECIAQKHTRTGSQKIRQAYEDTMRQFRDFLASGDLDLLSNPIDIARVAALWANMRDGKTRRPGEDVSPSTYNQRLTILSSWYTFVQEVYKLGIPNPIKDVARRNVQAYAVMLPIEPDAIETGLESINREKIVGLH